MRPASALLVVGSACVCSAAAIAQPDRPTPYVTEERSVLIRELCLDPCDCVAEPLVGPLVGHHTLTFSSDDPLFTTFRVDNVRWAAELDGREVPVTGSGRYLIGGEVAIQHRLVLELTVGDMEPQIFDSGMVLHAGRTFPYVDIAVIAPQHGCTRESIRLRSRPECLADFNMDGFLDFFDFDDFVHCFEGDRCPRFRTADYDGDGFVDMFDFDMFVREFEHGC
jgi:hypothetical protein